MSRFDELARRGLRMISRNKPDAPPPAVNQPVEMNPVVDIMSNEHLKTALFDFIDTMMEESLLGMAESYNLATDKHHHLNFGGWSRLKELKARLEATIGEKSA